MGGGVTDLRKDTPVREVHSVAGDPSVTRKLAEMSTVIQKDQRPSYRIVRIP